MTIFSRCFDGIEKNAGVLKSIGKALTKPIPGTKPWVMGRGAPAASSSMSGMRKAVRSRPPVSSTRRTSSGAYDVSDLARQMGIVGKND